LTFAVSAGGKSAIEPLIMPIRFIEQRQSIPAFGYRR
jgi:hypothetical protein